MNPIYYSETQKIKPKIEKYLHGNIIDIGCNRHKVTETAIGVDCVPYPGVSVVTKDLDKLSHFHEDAPLLTHLHSGNFDVVFSSHCLEHFQDDRAALTDWIKLLKPGGYLILYLPDDEHYDNSKNPEHLQRYTYAQFVKEILPTFPELQHVESGPDVGYDKYSFYIVAQKGRALYESEKK